MVRLVAVSASPSSSASRPPGEAKKVAACLNRMRTWPIRRLGGHGFRLLTRSSATSAFCASGRHVHFGQVGPWPNERPSVDNLVSNGFRRVDSMKRRYLCNAQRRSCRSLPLLPPGSQPVMREHRNAPFSRASRKRRGLSTSPCPLAGFAQVGYRAVSRESKFANGLWGRWTRGRKQNRVGIWRPRESLTASLSLRFLPRGRWGHPQLSQRHDRA